MPIAIRESSTRSLETLDQPRNLVFGWKFEEEVNVIGNHSDFNNTRAVALSFGEEERQEKLRHRRVDERQACPSCPRQVSVDADRH